eukprot:756778-Hanusia_phi.AAC.4
MAGAVAREQRGSKGGREGWGRKGQSASQSVSDSEGRSGRRRRYEDLLDDKLRMKLEDVSEGVDELLEVADPDPLKETQGRDAVVIIFGVDEVCRVLL